MSVWRRITTGRLALLKAALALGLLLVSLVALAHQHHSPLFRTAVPASSSSSSSSNSIPPIVHFVHLKDPAAPSPQPLHFSFEAYLALYAAYRAVRPSAMYIHTDYTRADVRAALHHASPWTRRALTAFPPLRINHIAAPTHTPAGRPLTRVEHRSDMVRLSAALARHGGIYLDWDVLALHALHPLLRAGFRAVVGREAGSGELVNNGILLAARDSAVLRILRDEAPRAFDGGWISHSVALLTRVVQRVAASAPGEVLVMDARAFSPFSWEQESVDRLLARHGGEEELQGLPPVGYYEVDDAEEAWRTRRETNTSSSSSSSSSSWVYDFSDAYFLHKFFNNVENPRGYNGVSVPYVLARDSNYALAAWPIVMQGIRDGFIDADDDSL